MTSVCLYSGIAESETEIYYDSFERIDGDTEKFSVKKGQFVIFLNDKIGKVTAIWQIKHKDGIHCEVKLFCRPSDTAEGFQPFYGSAEILPSLIVIDVMASDIVKIVSKLLQYNQERIKNTYNKLFFNSAMWKQKKNLSKIKIH